MATDEAEDRQCPEKVGLKRKLTGPPRLLLGKKSKTQAENRSEARAKRNKRETINNISNAAPSPKHSNAGVKDMGSPGLTQDNPARANKMKEAVSSESYQEHSRVRSISEEVDTTSEGHDIRSSKAKKRCWKRVFSPAIICIRRQRKDTSKTRTGDCDQGVRAAAPNIQTELSTLTEGKLTGEDPGSLNNKRAQDASNNENVTKGKKRFTFRTWPTFKRFLTSSYIRQRPERQAHVVEELSEDVQQLPVTFRKKLQGFLTHGRRVCSPVGRQEQRERTQDPEDKGVEFRLSVMPNGADQSASDVQMDDILEDSTEVIEQCSEVVTVTAEMSAQSPERVSYEKTCQDSLQDLILTEEQVKVDIEVMEEDPIDVENGSKMVRMDSEVKTDGGIACVTDNDSTTHNEVVDIAVDAHKVNIDDASKILSSEKEDVIELDTEIHYATSVAMDTKYHFSIQVISSKEAPEDVCREEKTDIQTTAETTSQNSQLLTNGRTDGIGVLQCNLCEINSSIVADLDAANLDGLCLEDGGWESGIALAEHYHFAGGESQLVQIAYSLVQAAMSAAMEQLAREQESTATNVHREVQGCRDHA